jgi:hypothetical protein
MGLPAAPVKKSSLLAAFFMGVHPVRVKFAQIAD